LNLSVYLFWTEYAALTTEDFLSLSHTHTYYTHYTHYTHTHQESLSTIQAGLKASDEASVVYCAEGKLQSATELCGVISDYKDYITTATKGDISTGDAPSEDVIAQDEQKVGHVKAVSVNLPFKNRHTPVVQVRTSHILCNKHSVV